MLQVLTKALYRRQNVLQALKISFVFPKIYNLKRIVTSNEKPCISLYSSVSLFHSPVPVIQSFQFLRFSSSSSLDSLQYDKISTETLESLTDYFEELIDSTPTLKSADVTYSDGVLTVSLGSNFGTYVINKQSPNLQIWLSSPTSGPKRYDFIDNTWIYKHDRSSLHQLLNEEISAICGRQLSFTEVCSHGKCST